MKLQLVRESKPPEKSIADLDPGTVVLHTSVNRYAMIMRNLSLNKTAVFLDNGGESGEALGAKTWCPVDAELVVH